VTNLYHRLCIVIYKYYIRKEGEGNGELFTTFLVTTLILTFNVFAIYDSLAYFIFGKYSLDIYFAFILLFGVAFFNYLVVFRRKMFLEKMDISKPNDSKLTLLYIAITITLSILVGTLQREKNIQDKKQKEQEAIPLSNIK